MSPNEQISAILEPSKAWIMYSYFSFGLSILALLGGIAYLELDVWVRGFLLMGVIFMAGNCFSLSKLLRDQHEAQSWRYRLDAAKTKELLDKYDEPA